MTYRVQYLDAESGELVKNQNYTTDRVETSNPVDQPVSIDVAVNLDLPKGYDLVSAQTGNGQELVVDGNTIQAVVVEKASGLDRTFQVLVRKGENAGQANSLSGTTAFRNTTATGQNVNDLVTATTSFSVEGGGKNATPPTVQLTNAGRLDVVSSYKVDDAVKEGDYFTVVYGDAISYSGGSANLTTADGATIARGSYDAASKTMTYTFTDYVDRHRNVEGTLKHSTYANSDIITTDNLAYPIDVTVAGEKHAENIYYTYGNGRPVTSNPQTDRIVTYVNAYSGSAVDFGGRTDLELYPTGIRLTNPNQVTVYEIPRNYQVPDNYKPDLSKLKKVSKTVRIVDGNAIVTLGTVGKNNRYVVITTPPAGSNFDGLTGVKTIVYGAAKDYGLQHGATRGNGVLPSTGSGTGDLVEPTFSLGDTVWVDTNKDGVQNETGTGKAGVTVNLLDEKGYRLATTTTDSEGKYLFTDLKNGNYKVEVVPPSDMTVTSADQGGNDASDSDFTKNTDGRYIAPVTINNADVLTIDAGLIENKTYTLGDTVWVDTNRDGIQNETGTGKAGVTVKLIDSVGREVGTTVTDQDGKYQFTGLTNGLYYVEIIPPADMEVTTANQGGDDEQDSDFQLNPQNRYIVVATINDADITSVDAGLVEKTYTLGDTVWVDTNKDGIQNETGTGKSGVTVNLLNENGDIIATTTTNADGKYEFTGLTNGNYKVEVVPPSDFDVTNADQGGDDEGDSDFTKDSTGRYITPVTINNANITSVDAGLVPVSKGSVVITYVDINGEEIKPEVKDTTDREVGTPYNTKEGDNEWPATITTADGKTYKRVPAGNYPVGTTTEDGHLTTSDDPTGVVEEGTKKVTYVYEEVKDPD
ncbi:TPA: SdrD B-like domain-containing protein, partial [Streptococcus suis]